VTRSATVARPAAEPPALRGRPRDPGLRGRVHAATLALLAEGGFHALSMDRIAARADVSKATLYGRWSSKEELVVDAVTKGISADLPPAPDTGDAIDDLRLLLDALCAAMRGSAGRIIRPLVGELIHDPGLAAAFRDHFVTPRRARVREVVERGIAAGQLDAEADVALLTDVGAALVFHRLLVTGEPIPDDLPERIIRQFVAPLVVPTDAVDTPRRPTRTGPTS